MSSPMTLDRPCSLILVKIANLYSLFAFIDLFVSDPSEFFQTYVGMRKL